MATIPPNSMPPPVTQLLGINSKSVMVCSNCKRSKERPDTAHIVDMVYPRRVCLENAGVNSFRRLVARVQRDASAIRLRIGPPKLAPA